MLSYRQLQQIIEHINKIQKNKSTQEYIDLFIESHKSTFTENDIKYFLSQTKKEKIITALNEI